VNPIPPSDNSPTAITPEPLQIEEEEGSEAEPTVRTRRFATVMICLNSMLGMGILGVPNAYANTGFVTSTVLLVLMSGLSLVATWMIIVLADGRIRRDLQSSPDTSSAVSARSPWRFSRSFLWSAR
jgi:hypothetical protein